MQQNKINWNNKSYKNSFLIWNELRKCKLYGKNRISHKLIQNWIQLKRRMMINLPKFNLNSGALRRNFIQMAIYKFPCKISSNFHCVKGIFMFTLFTKKIFVFRMKSFHVDWTQKAYKIDDIVNFLVNLWRKYW